MKNLLKKTSLAVFVIAMGFLAVSCGTKNPEYVGEWIHTCNGKEDSFVFWDLDENKVATEELLLNADGTFTRIWVGKYWTNDGGTWLRSGEIARNVSEWGGGTGKWKIKDETLILDYDETTGEEFHQEFETEFNEEKTILKVNKKSYKKSK